MSERLPDRVRVSVGSAIVLGLSQGRLDAAPTTVYLMTYREGKCTANCSFCPQARGSTSKADMLSRISWPVFPTEQVLEGISGAGQSGRIKRVCIQALNYPEVFDHLQGLVRSIRQKTSLPISVSCQPLTSENLKLLAEAGVDRIGIPLDAATEKLFDAVKGALANGPYEWKRQLGLLEEAVHVFGKWKVSTHVIIGLGETEREMIEIIQMCADIGVLPALFAFTPIAGTVLEKKSQPSMRSYRLIQVSRSLILRGLTRSDKMRFDDEGRLLDLGVNKQTLTQLVQTSGPFVTSGCPGCNRPYYNEKPSGPIYNYPRDLTEKEFAEIRKQLGLVGA